MRLPRFRIRTMMIAVVVVALLTAAWRLQALSADYDFRRAQAAAKASESWVSMKSVEAQIQKVDQKLSEVLAHWDTKLAADETGSLRQMMGGTVDDVKRVYERIHASSVSDLRRYTAAHEYYRLLERKYQRAARYPWLPVEPDPPKPE